MTDVQEEFLNELGKLFNKYCIDIVRVGNGNNDEPANIEFWSNNQKLAFYKYARNSSIQKSGKAPFGVFSVVSTFESLTEYHTKKEESNNE